ncbi:hypothetical protein COU37_00605 [Candidatus Micrarchaeota archaeon CG10_big_fil_rev_8_21_14_0_10_45_29]|nr:MAG: hypothetical protein COU37_00605 [Candidatus Micrarchaeota archaeon CG10_big_fil_rev_8_21_14_0_10_45_29]
MNRFGELEQVRVPEVIENYRPSFEKVSSPLAEQKLAQQVQKPASERFSQILYEFRSARRELEESIERLERLARIGMMVNKLKAKNQARPGDDSGSGNSGSDDDSGKGGEKTIISSSTKRKNKKE